MTTIADIVNNFNRDYLRTFESIESSNRLISSNLTPVVKYALRAHAEIERLKTHALAPGLPAELRAYAEIERLIAAPRKQRKEQEVLGRAGWYVDPNWPCTFAGKVADAIKSGQRQVVDEALTKSFDERAAEIRDRMCERFPKRDVILKEAFDAHIAGKYALSTPVLLIQSEGIWHDATGEQFFSKGGDKRPKPSTYVDKQFLSDYEQSLFYAAVTAMPIVAGPVDRETMSGILNRHEILHGESVDYPSRVNSCKAISLICYISWLVEVLRRQAEVRASAGS